MSLSRIQMNQLRKIAAAHNNDPAYPDQTKYALVKPKQVSALVAQGLILVNAAVAPNANGEQPARATAAGIAALQSPEASAPAKRVTQIVPEGGFQLESGLAVPPPQRGGGRGAKSIYPFAQMEVGQSFAVPATVAGETSDKIAKRLSTAVSAANRKGSTNGAAKVNPDGSPKLNAKGQPVYHRILSHEFVVRAKDANGQPYTFNGAQAARVFRVK